jgi:hypothetical protein
MTGLSYGERDDRALLAIMARGNALLDSKKKTHTHKPGSAVGKRDDGPLLAKIPDDRGTTDSGGGKNVLHLICCVCSYSVHSV